MRTLVAVSALAMLVAACGQIPGMDGDADTAAAPSEEVAAPEAVSDPHSADLNLTLEHPTVALVDGYWWADSRGNLESGLGTFLVFRDDHIYRIKRYSEGERNFLHRIGLDDAAIERTRLQSIVTEKVTSCSDRTLNADGAASLGAIYLTNDCVEVVSVLDNVMTTNTVNSDGSRQLYRVTGEVARALDADLAALIQSQAAGQ